MAGEPRDPKRPHGGAVVDRAVFDLERYAAEAVARERLPTILDDVATEAARLASVRSDSPPPIEDVEIAVTYSELDALDAEVQLEILRARLAPLSRVPVLTRKIADIGWLIEDPKTAYLLGFVDGTLPIDALADVAGLPELDALRILDRMVEHHVVTFDTTARVRTSRG